MIFTRNEKLGWSETGRMRDFVMPFGPFKGLSLDEIRWLRAGDEIKDWDQDQDQDQDNDQDKKPLVVTDDTEGVRYLDRLLGEEWIWPQTRELIAKFLNHPNMRHDLAIAFGRRMRDEKGVLWPLGNEREAMAFPAYGDGADGSMEPSGFQVSETYDQSNRRWLGKARWLKPERNGRAVLPEGEYHLPDGVTPHWDQADLERMEAGAMGGRRVDRTSENEANLASAWQDQRTWEDEQRDWEPPTEPSVKTVHYFVHRSGKREAIRTGCMPERLSKPTDPSQEFKFYSHSTNRVVTTWKKFAAEEVSFDSWSRGLDIADSLSRICSVDLIVRNDQELDEQRARLKDIKQKARFLLGSREAGAGKPTWHEAVPDKIKKLVSDAVTAASDRIAERAIWLEEERQREAQERLNEQARKAKNKEPEGKARKAKRRKSQKTPVAV